MNPTNLTFPLLTIGSGGSMDVARTNEQLRTCTLGGLKSRAYSGMQLITREGNRYKIINAHKGGVAKSWWKKPLLFTTFYFADLEICEAGKVDLVEIKRLLRKAYKTDHLSWDEAWGEYAEFDTELEKCHTFEQVAKLFP